MKIGTFILNYKNKKQVDEAVKKLSAYNSIDSILVIDNNSGDKFEDLLLISNKVNVIYNKNNNGYASGNNLGFNYYINQKDYDIVFLMNPDVLVEEETIVKISKFLREHNEYCIASSKRYDNDFGYNALQFWNTPNFCECLMESFYLYRRYNYKKRRLESLKQIKTAIDKGNDFLDVDVVPGAFFGANLKKIQTIDFLDEGTFLWFEENILSKKMDLQNYKRCILLNCLYYHNHINSGKRGNKLFHFYNKSKIHYYKNYVSKSKFKFCVLKFFSYLSNIEQSILNFIGKIKR